MKRGVIFHRLIVALLLFCCLLLGVCSENAATATYATMEDAVNAVLDSNDQEMTYANGMYLYENQDCYDNKEATYVLAFFEGDVTSCDYETVIYSVKDEIHKAPWVYFTVPLQPEILQTPGVIAYHQDLTHSVVDLVRDRGRRLDREAFASGHQLAGHFEGCWFYVSFIGNNRNIQAAYNTETEELIVADSINDGLRTAYVNMDWIPYCAAEKIYVEDFKKIISLFPESKLTIEGMVSMANKIAYEGYAPDASNTSKEPIQSFLIEDNNGNDCTLEIFEDGSWVYFGGGCTE